MEIVHFFHVSVFLDYLSVSLQNDGQFMYKQFLPSVIHGLDGEKTYKPTIPIPYAMCCDRNTHSALMGFRGKSPRLWSGVPGARRQGREEGEEEVHRAGRPTNESQGKKNDTFYDVHGEIRCVWRIMRPWGNGSETGQVIRTRIQELCMPCQGAWILSQRQ